MKSIAFGDYDGDGDIDLLVGVYGAMVCRMRAQTSRCMCTSAESTAHAFRPHLLPQNKLLYNDGSGAFSVDTTFPDGGAVNTYAVAFGDVDDDGDLDVFIGDGIGSNGEANELLLYQQCPTTGAKLHSGSACFACPSFMGLEKGICLECLPDSNSEGTVTGSQTCLDSFACVLGQRPIGTDSCVACRDIPGTWYNTGLAPRTASNPTAWASTKCTDCEAGRFAIPTTGTGAVCLPCMPGKYADGTASTTCTSCPAGKYSEDVMSSSCDLCAVGGFCADEGAASASMAYEECPGASRNPHACHTRMSM